MPRFFIDTDDGEYDHRDTEGREFPDLEAARQVALRALPDLVKERILQGKRGSVMASVRGPDGTILYRTSLHFREGYAPFRGRQG